MIKNKRWGSAFYHALIENSEDAIALTDKESNWIYLSPSAERISGWSAVEILGRQAIENIHPDDRESFIHTINKVLENPGEPIFSTFRTQRKGGDFIHLEGLISNLLTNEHVNGIVYNFKDISQRKKSEENLQRMIKEISDYKYALDESSIVAITDQKGIIKHANNNFCTISKYSKEELIGQDHRIINSGHHPKEFIRRLWQTIAHGQIWRGELKNKAKDGSIYWVDTTIVPFLNEGGKPYQYVAIRADITQRKKTEEEYAQNIRELERSNKYLEQFAFIVSHNLRLPVANIIGFAEILKNDEITEQQKLEFMDAILASVGKLDEVVNDLNQVLQIKRELNENRELVEFSKLVDDILKSIQMMVQKEKPEIITDFMAINEVKTLKSYMYSVFYNLISNSMKYRQANVPLKIEIKSRIKADKLLLSFKDNGSGIDLNRHQDQVFRLYKKFHSKVEGKGMGLFMVKTQVEILGGKIDIKSQVNVGTEFLLEFDINRLN